MAEAKSALSEDSSNETMRAIAKGYASSGANSGQSGMSTAGNTMMTAGAMTANPALLAAGGAMTLLGNVADKKAKARQRAEDAEESRKRLLVQTLNSLGSGVGSKGMA